MAKKVKENNEVSAVRRSKHGGVLTVFFSLLTVFYLYPIFLVLINSFKKKGFITKMHLHCRMRDPYRIVKFHPGY